VRALLLCSAPDWRMHLYIRRREEEWEQKIVRLLV